MLNLYKKYLFPLAVIKYSKSLYKQKDLDEKDSLFLFVNQKKLGSKEMQDLFEILEGKKGVFNIISTVDKNKMAHFKKFLKKYKYQIKAVRQHLCKVGNY